MSSQTTILEGLSGNPATAEIGTLAASGTATALSATTTVWNGGIWVSNGDATLGIFVGPTGVTAAVGTNRIYIGPGQCLPYLLSRKLTEIFVIAASGSPTVTYQASGT